MDFARKGLKISSRPVLGKRLAAVLPFLLFTVGWAQAQTAPPSPTDAQQRERIERQLQELQSMKKDLQRQLGDFDARIKALEIELGAPTPKGVTPGPIQSTNQPTALPSPPQASSRALSEEGPKNLIEPGLWGAYEPGRGFVFVRTPYGEVDFGIMGYLRYLNQLALAPTFTDAFGREHDFDKRQDLQVNRFQFLFRGWLFDERLGYNAWVWTQNTSAGEQTQLNVGGNAWYTFYEWLTFRGGIFSLPTTRSTSQTFPNWIKIDHRTMSDEFFRGSYSTAIMLEGKIVPGLEYKTALGNHLSTLGVSAAQLDPHLNTTSSALFWMPTTGEFGPALGFGDYENHQKLATLLGAHYTFSREDKQSQPNTEGFENTQIFLSDGTLIFSSNPFNTGGFINTLHYQMVALDAGLKYKGWSLEGEYYFRLLNDFDTVGPIPTDHVFDHGFEVQASKMLLPKTLQAYVAPAKIFGQYGSPWEVELGLTYFPFHRKEVRMNVQALYVTQAAAGNLALPYQPGARGWIYTVDIGAWF